MRPTDSPPPAPRDDDGTRGTDARQWRRRDVLRLAGSALLLPACGGQGADGRDSQCELPARSPAAMTPDPWADAPLNPSAAESMLKAIFTTPANELVAEVVARRKQGLGYRDLVGALLAASVVPSALEVHKRANIFATHQLGRTWGDDTDLPLMFALLKLKGVVSWWHDPPEKALVDPPALDAAPAALADALEAWDADAAKTAAAVLCRAGEPARCQPALLEYGARNHDWIGHTTIDVVQSLRALDLGGWLRAEAVIAALIDHICLPTHKSVDDFAASRAHATALAGAVHDDGSRATEDPGAVAEQRKAALALVARWRHGDAEDAVASAVDHLGCGRTSTLWQACRLAAAEQTLRYPIEGWAKYAIHAVTTTNALRHAFDSTTDARLRLLLLLQAVAFIQREKAQAHTHAGEPEGQAWHIDALSPAPPPPATLDGVFSKLLEGRPVITAAALGWLEAGGSLPALVVAYRDRGMRHAMEEHQTKHSAAAFEEAALAGPLMPVIAACAFSYGYEPQFAPWAEHDATRATLEDG